MGRNNFLILSKFTLVCGRLFMNSWLYVFGTEKTTRFTSVLPKLVYAHLKHLRITLADFVVVLFFQYFKFSSCYNFKDHFPFLP